MIRRHNSVHKIQILLKKAVEMMLNKFYRKKTENKNVKTHKKNDTAHYSHP